MARTNETTLHHLVDKRFVGISSDGHRVMIDGEKEHATGMRPMDLLLNAVGSCAAYDVVAMLEKRRLEVRAYEIHLEGDRADGVPSPYTRIRAVHRFDVPGLDTRTAQRFADLAMRKYCSVASSLREDIEIEVEVELLHDDAENDAGGADDA